MSGLTKSEQKAIEHGVRVVEAGRGKLDYVLVALGEGVRTARVDVRTPAKAEMVKALKRAIRTLEGPLDASGPDDPDLVDKVW